MDIYNTLISTPAKKPNFWKWLCYFVIATLSLYIFTYQYNFKFADMWRHAEIAASFDYSDLHTITSQITYMLWHLLTSLLYNLGIPLGLSAGISSTFFKLIGMVCTWYILRAISGKNVSDNVITLFTFISMIITGIWVPGVNDAIYKGVGSPTVWHNPTQQAAVASMFLCFVSATNCYHCFEDSITKDKDSIFLLPVKKLFILGFLLLLSVLAKPTFFQAMFPAFSIFYLVIWIKNPKQWRYIMQVFIAVLPTVCYFIMQYLYYTGVLVPFTSGATMQFNINQILFVLRNALILNAFPFVALVLFYKKGMFKDKNLVLILLMLIVAIIEGCIFAETGAREGHGNFTWALSCISLIFIIYMLGLYLKEWSNYINTDKKSIKKVSALIITTIVLLWQLYSSFYYLYLLLFSWTI